MIYILMLLGIYIYIGLVIFLLDQFLMVFTLGFRFYEGGRTYLYRIFCWPIYVIREIVPITKTLRKK